MVTKRELKAGPGTVLFMAMFALLLAGIIGIVRADDLNRDLFPPDLLGPCPTEDSTHCYWDADRQGNGVGEDFVAP